MPPSYELNPVGYVESPLKDLASAPKQGDEGSPDSTILIEEAVLEAIDGIEEGQRVIVLTWLDRADREVLKVHPRSNRANPLQGVFNTRSPDRPNPIGLHEVEILSVDGPRLRVRDLEAVDGTPVVDIKPVIGPRR